MKRGVLLLMGIVMLVGLSGCAGYWPMPQPTVTITTTSTVYTPTPEPSVPLPVCELPTDDMLKYYPRPGAAPEPTLGQMMTVNIGAVSSMPGSQVWAVVVNTDALLGPNNNSGAPLDTWLFVSQADDMSDVGWYGVDMNSINTWTTAPLTGNQLYRAEAAMLKAMACLINHVRE